MTFLGPKVLKYSDVFSLVDPITDTGRTYKLSKIEMENASNILAKIVKKKKKIK